MTTGGTGLTPRDVTPEATKNIIHREAPQIAIVMLLYSLQKTKFAALSRYVIKCILLHVNANHQLFRAVCGIRNNTLIINMPGSKKAVTECFESIVDIIPHAIMHMQNEVIQIKKIHTSIQNSNDTEVKLPVHKHVCPHKTGTGDANDRNSPFPMMPVDECIKLIFESVNKLPHLTQRVSHLDLPPFEASIKDGYAVKTSGGKGKKKVIGFISAGDEVDYFIFFFNYSLF